MPVEQIANKTLRWGIIGLGKIAEKFARALPLAGNALLQAVASRDIAKANDFAGRHQAVKSYGTYEELVTDPDIDVVYIATPHAFHQEQALLCLQHGKAVLCEKPMALNGRQVKEMMDAAKQRHTFLMEAMWTRFLPIIAETLKIISAGEIGEVISVSADFGFDTPFDPKSRLFDLNLGGGSLLDIGVYPLFLVLLLLGEPEGIRATGKLSATGADETCDATLYYHNGIQGAISSGVSRKTSLTAHITGTKGSITIPEPWYKTNTLILDLPRKDAQTITFDPITNGFEYQIREVARCLQEGRIESPKMPHAFSLLLSETMDKIREQIGVVYPADNMV